jgi:Domain of unknown function (DUF4382)
MDMLRIMLRRALGSALLIGLLASLAGCGGGGGSSGGSSGPMQGVANVSLTDAPGDFIHVYVTVSALWFHTSSTAGPDDAGWVKFTLSAPVTVDLLSLENGTLLQAFSVSPPNGSYQQIRLFLIDNQAALTSSAKALSLSENDEVFYDDASDTAQNAPLEIVSPSKGVAIYGTFQVTSTAPVDLALDFNVDRDVLKFYAGNQVDFVLNPRLAYFDLSHVGAITGSVDCADLLVDGGAGFAYGLVIKAESPSSDGTYQVVDRETGLKVDLANNSCTFTLFPVQVPVGSSSTSYDVMIRGRNMASIIVQGVPVQAGTDPSTATVLSASPLSLMQGTEYTANMPANMAVSPTGAVVRFYQTVPGTAASYEIRTQGVNPFTGVFTDDEPLSLDDLQVGAYVSGGTPKLTATVPNEGAGGFVPFGDAPYFVRTEALTGTLMPPAASPASFTVGALAIASGASADSISGDLTQSTAGQFDAGFLIVSHDGYIVTTLNLQTVLAQNGGTGGAYSIANLPGGSAAQTFMPGLYYLHGFVWNSAHPLLTLRRVEDAAVVDLRSGSATNVDFTVP